MKKLLLTAVLLALAFFNAYAEEEEGEETGSNRTKTPPSVEDIDTDGDGLVSQEEFNQFRQGDDDDDEEEGDESEQEGDGLSAFASFDKDRDGFVTQEELNAHAKYSNPGNGTGELKTNRQSNNVTSSSSSSRSQGNSNRSESRGNSGNSNKGGGNRGGGGGGNKGGKDK
ncbi:hypothetical protein [Vibrio tubiashii]|uniref:hypothetical protein n=1 Tax=Vibrio tubiashii TaxID=29498 RepID=UPI00349EE788